MDVHRLIGAVRRELTDCEKDGAPARCLVATRTYDTTIDDLWDALTNAERIPRWFLPISGDLRPGGRYQLTGNAGGTITECAPPRRFEVTWEMHGDVSWVNVEFSEAAKGRTLLTLRHIARPPKEFWDQYGPGAVGVGWDLGLWALGRHLAERRAIEQQEGMAWVASEEGRAFVRGSSDAWGDASVAAGTGAEAARAAAARTTAFYTPPPAPTEG